MRCSPAELTARGPSTSTRSIGAFFFLLPAARQRLQAKGRWLCTRHAQCLSVELWFPWSRKHWIGLVAPSNSSLCFSETTNFRPSLLCSLVGEMASARVARCAHQVHRDASGRRTHCPMRQAPFVDAFLVGAIDRLRRDHRARAAWSAVLRGLPRRAWSSCHPASLRYLHAFAQQ